MVTRLISATGSEIEKMSPMELKESVFKSEGRVVMGQHLLFASEGLVRGVTNSELMFAFGADMVMLNTFDLDNLDNLDLPDDNTNDNLGLSDDLGLPEELNTADNLDLSLIHI